MQMETSATAAANGVLPATTTEILARVQTVLQQSSLSVADGQTPLLEQAGTVVVGPGTEKEAQLLGLGLPVLALNQQEDLARTKKYAMEQSVKLVLMRQTVVHQQQQQKVAMYAQALSLMARIYLGGVSFDLREDIVKNAFAPFGPIKSINMSWDPITGHHKGFAFLEFDVPEAAFLAQEQMNGVLIGGRNVKVVGRPSNMPQAQPIIEMIMEEARVCNRVYVASVHPDLNEADLWSVFEAFGQMTSCQLAKANVHGTSHRGYGYLEYDNPQSVMDAVASMNLFDLGGQYLRVCKAITPPQAQTFAVPTQVSNLPTAAAVAAAAATAKIQAMEASAWGSPVAAAGVVSAPAVVVGATLDDIAGVTSSISLPGAVYSVPAPGLAIPHGSSPSSLPDIPESASRPGEPPPQVITPHLASLPPAKEKWPGTPSTPSDDSMALVSVEPAGAPPKKKKPKKKKPKMDKANEGANPMLNSQQKVDVDVQKMQQSTTTAKLMGCQALTEKQKQMLELDAGSSLSAQEDVRIKGNEARNALMHKLMRKVESCVLVLLNMAQSEDVDEYLQEEVEAECSKYGQVHQVVIYQEKQGEAPDAPIHVKIFVKFSLPQEAEAARKSLDSRFFDGRQIRAEIYDQYLFDRNDLTS